MLPRLRTNTPVSCRMPTWRTNTPVNCEASHDVLPLRCHQVIGHHPKLSVTELYSYRRDHLTKEMKRIPKMTHNLESNRALVPEHMLLEEDWRACRMMLKNWERAKYRHMTWENKNDVFLKENKTAYEVLGMEAEDKDLVKHSKSYHDQSYHVISYKTAAETPVGTLYRKYLTAKKEEHLQERMQENQNMNQDERMLGQRLQVPVLKIEDPFAKQFIPQCDDRPDYEVKAKSLVEGLPERPLIHNEPDCITEGVARDNLDFPLVARTLAKLDRTNVVERGSRINPISNISILKSKALQKSIYTDDTSKTGGNGGTDDTDRTVERPKIPYRQGLPPINVDKYFIDTNMRKYP